MVAPDAADLRVRWGMGDALLATFVGIVASVVAVGIALGVADADEVDELPLWTLALIQVPLWIGLAGVPVWAARRKSTGSVTVDFGVRMTRADVPVGLGAGVLSQLGLAVLGPPLYRLLGADPDKIGETAEELADRAADPFGVVLLVVVVVLGAAVVEELCYRGLWLRAIERRWGTATAVVLSALVFGLVHFQLYDLPLLAAFGLVLALLTVRTGRLGAAIWAHVAFNLVALATLL